ncbi:MAG TPA: hypothetical protein VGA70_14310 [Longimicrobiales bacterium]
MIGGIGALCAFAAAWGTTPALAQDLADFDYENLSFRGVALHGGHLVPSRVEETWSMGVRADLGYLGPGLRIVPHLTYWSSDFKRREVRELERSVEDLIDRENPGDAPHNVDLGTISWSDLALGLDAHVVWAVPFDFLGYAGLGAAVHFLNGDGESIAGTFVEDLLDAADAGINVHAGLEYPWDGFRLFTEARFELIQDLRYLEFRIGGQFMTGRDAPGERDR